MPEEDSGINNVLGNLDAYLAEVRGRRRRAAEKIAIVLETYAKAHHGDIPQPARTVYPRPGMPVKRPAGIGWMDVTGNTQSSTHGTVSRDLVTFVEVALHAGMPYDVFLETARNGRWAWLWPAVVANQDRILTIFATELAG